MRFRLAIQNSVQFKSHELFISGIFHLIFLDHGQPRVAEITQGETVSKGDYWVK